MISFNRNNVNFPTCLNQPKYNPQWIYKTTWLSNQNDRESILQELRKTTNRCCTFCGGGYILGAHTSEEIEHFFPRSKFPYLAYSWDNLFLSCTQCNRLKKDKFSYHLLKPDSPDFNFEKYFYINLANGELKVNPKLSQYEYLQAEETIKLYQLNRSALTEMRLDAIENFQKNRIPMKNYSFIQRLI